MSRCDAASALDRKGNVLLDGAPRVMVQVWAKSDIGRQRTINEDCHYVDPDLEFVLVLDGMGGHRAGEVAARLAMGTIVSFYKAHSAGPENDLKMFDSYDDSFTYHTNLLRQAAYNANRAVLAKASESYEMAGMGSTVAGLAIHGGAVSMINVGDSRVYLIRNRKIEQLSRDHTLAEDQVELGMITREEAHESQIRHILSSVIGVDDRVRVHMDELNAVAGDVFLLCTDGLTAVVDEGEILQEILIDEPGPGTLSRLIDQANARGGPDNITLALAVVT